LSTVIASTKVFAVLRSMPSDRRTTVRALRHSDGGVWMTAIKSDGETLILELAALFGTKSWGPRGWVLQRAQLRLPGI
jgi:hypothetical protein